MHPTRRPRPPISARRLASPRLAALAASALLALAISGAGCGGETSPLASGGAGGADGGGGEGGTSRSSASSASSSGSAGGASSASSSGSGGTQCLVDADCASGRVCEEGACAASSTSCGDDTYGADGYPDAAPSLGTIKDCDDAGKTRSGVLLDDNDVDWFEYRGDDSIGCKVNPTVDVTKGSVRICQFATCSGSVSCPSGTTKEKSSDFSPAAEGCCSSSGASFSMGLDCEGTNDSSDVFVRVDHPSEACTEYAVKFHF